VVVLYDGRGPLLQGPISRTSWWLSPRGKPTESYVLRKMDGHSLSICSTMELHLADDPAPVPVASNSDSQTSFSEGIRSPMRSFWGFSGPSVPGEFDSCVHLKTQSGHLSCGRARVLDSGDPSLSFVRFSFGFNT